MLLAFLDCRQAADCRKVAWPFPAYPLFLTTELTQIAGTIIAVYGIFMQPISWALAGLVWGHSLLLFLINDFVKVKTFKMMNHNDSNLGTPMISWRTP
jgi:hypothetical protein